MPAVGLAALLLRPLSYGSAGLVTASAVLIGCILAAVHHAEVVAHRVGEPFGTLILAVAVNAERDFLGETRSNTTHASTTDPDARLFKKARGQAAKLCHIGHVLMENRHSLVVDTTLTHATGTAEREAALTMLKRLDGCHRITLGTVKAYDTADFIANLRAGPSPPGATLRSIARVT